MKLKKFLEKWYGKEIEDWGGIVSDEYKQFEKEYKAVLKEFTNFEIEKFNKNHYEFSAVLKSKLNGRFYYVSISDVRYFKNEWADDILVRTMAHEKDWTGGTNERSNLKNLEHKLNNLVERGGCLV